MLYSMIVKKRIRQAFDQVNNRRWDELMKSIAPNVHHRFGGAHAIGGQRHDRETLRRWFERLARVLPNLQLKINNIWVKGWPWHTMVFVQWDGTATLLNGEQVLSARRSCDHPAVGQDPRARRLRRFASGRPCACRPSGSWTRRSGRRTHRELAEAQSEAHRGQSAWGAGGADPLSDGTLFG